MIDPLIRTTSARSPATNIVAADEYVALMRSLTAAAGSPIIRSLGIVSTRPGAGVSTTALQCAFAAATIFSEPVALIEANTVRPSLRATLKLEPAAGVAELASGKCNRDDCLQLLSDELFVVTAGQSQGGRPFAWSADAVATAIETLHEGHRLVIWDLPPLGADPGALKLASRLDGVLLVVEAEQMSDREAQNAAADLQRAGARLLGAVLTKQREHLPNWLQSRL